MHKFDYLPRKFARIHLELTNRCNFSCVFCPDALMQRPRGFMDPALARRALDEIARLRLAGKVTFHVMGEPLLHPQFFDIARHAREVGIPVGLTTNGALLTGSKIPELASLGLTQIDISLQTPDEASFHATRGTKMDFKIYRERVIELLAASRNIPNPPIFKIRVMTTGLARKLRAQLGIPDFTNSSEALHRVVEEWVSPVYEALHMDIRRFLPRELRRARIYAWNVIEIAPKVFIETYVLTDWGNAFSGAGIIPANRGWCFGMRDHFAVMYNGDVTLCCVDYEGRTSLGNLSTSSIEEILGNPESARIIRGLRKGRLLHEHCRNCLGSHSTLGSWTKPTMSFVGLELLKPFFYRTYRVYS